MTKPVRGYQAPGEGRTFGISLATSITLFVGWDLITRFGVLPPLILPSPTAVWQAFYGRCACGVARWCNHL